MPQGRRRDNNPTRSQVELRRIEYEAQRMARRYDLAGTVARGAITIVCIAVASFPIREFIRPIAGHHTVFSASATVSIVLGGSVLLHALRESKHWSRRRELDRQRDVIKELENRLLSADNDDDED